MKYYTEDGSAKAGLHYESVSGEAAVGDGGWLFFLVGGSGSGLERL